MKLSQVVFSLVVVMAISLSFHTVPRAAACGGPSYADLGVLESVDSTLELIAFPDADEAAWGASAREEFRFLYPFLRERPAEIQPLWDFSYGGKANLPGPSFVAFEKAVRSGDLALAEREARAVIDAILALPPVPAAEHSALLFRAVEYIELRPHLAGVPLDVVRGFLLGTPPQGSLPSALLEAQRARSATPGPAAGAIPTFGDAHPRAASLELWTLQRDFRTRIPNGWSDAVKNQVPSATWRDLENGVDRWLEEHPGHPLADYTRLGKVRIRYFAGDAPGAWQVLFDMYPRRLPRVLAEMRYLLLQGKPPSRPQLDSLSDPVLITAFANDSTITPARWSTWWALAQSQPSRPWAVNLEERLLLWAAQNAKPGSLPPNFPTTARNPTLLWGKLRAVALIKSGDLGAARAELASLSPDAEKARLSAQVDLARGRPDVVVNSKELNADTRSYLVRVRLDTPTLERLSKQRGPSERDARFELGVRLAASGRWSEGAKLIERDDRERAGLFRQAAALAADRRPMARLKLARFLDAHEGSLFYEADTAFYRAISSRYEVSRGGSAEARQIEAALTRGTARWLALEAYARWLSANPRHPEARDALDEADRAYNRLINWAGGDYFFWGHYAKRAEAIATIRRVGKIIRRPPARSSKASPQPAP